MNSIICMILRDFSKHNYFIQQHTAISCFHINANISCIAQGIQFIVLILQRQNFFQLPFIDDPTGYKLFSVCRDSDKRSSTTYAIPTEGTSDYVGSGFTEIGLTTD